MDSGTSTSPRGSRGCGRDHVRTHSSYLRPAQVTTPYSNVSRATVANSASESTPVSYIDSPSPQPPRPLSQRGSWFTEKTPLLPEMVDGVIATAPYTARRRGPLPGARIVCPCPPLRSQRSEEHTSELQSLRHLVCRL